MAGKLTPAADVYSFGIMLWEMVSRTPPFAGLHHGEIIHKVVTQDLRPGERVAPSWLQHAGLVWGLGLWLIRCTQVGAEFVGRAER